MSPIRSGLSILPITIKIVLIKKIYKAKVKPPRIAKLAFPGILWNIPNSGNNIFLTFDDGPIPGVTEWVLDTLKSYNIKASFFCVGENVKKYPQIFERIIFEGHSVGCHTHNHVNAWKTKRSEYLNNIKQSEEFICSNLFRPPYGKIRKKLIKKLTESYNIIMWDVLSKDYDINTSPEACYENVISHAKNGSIVVFHDSVKSEQNLKYALPRSIEYLLSNDYTFAPITL